MVNDSREAARAGEPPEKPPRPASPTPDRESDSGVAVQEGRPRLKEPPKYAVLLHNDDYTTMEFVIEILRRYFQKTEEEAARIMLRVHHEGCGVAGVFSHEIAETKVIQVQEHAKSRGFPLKCTIEEQ
jgi:ATP-dependent Clp protease adaptor protein ClpS